jgi:type VI secretion system FHA domain protein
MILTLDVRGPEAAKLGAANQKVFHAVGGTIGRLPDNQWVLPDPHVSGRHAVVLYASGVFYVEDTSTNGVCINSPDNRLARGQPYALTSGDRIFIEPFEIDASITSAALHDAGTPFDDPFEGTLPELPSSGSDPFAADDPADHHAMGTPGSRVEALVPGVEQPLIPCDEVDPLRLLGLHVERAPASNPLRAADLAVGSVLNEPYQALEPLAARTPAPRSSGSRIPQDYDPSIADDRRVPPRPTAVRNTADERLPERPPSIEASTRSADVELSAVLAGAGLEGIPVTPELARSFGRILRIVIAGVMDVLHARQQTKEEFRMGMTRFKPAHNNPLKFSANVDDALHNLLVKRNAAFLGPVEAFEDAFDDLRHHQMATLAGVRVAFEAMLAEFDPERLEQQFDCEGRKAALLPLPAWLRYWDRYRDRFHAMRRDADETFRDLFGDEFAKAYEEQLGRLKARSRGRQH